MAYQLRERDADTLEKMQVDVVGVEINILAKKARLRNERRVTIEEENSNSDEKIDSLAKNLERMMDRLDNIEKIPHWDNQQQIRNPNFRKNINHGKSKETGPDQTIRPQFQENYDESYQNNDEDEDDINHIMGIDEINTIFLTREDQELFEL